jgi:hypothetical protein
MNNSNETLEQSTIENEPTLREVLDAINQVNKRLDGYDLQFESIRQGIVDNGARFDRLEGNFLLLRASVTELTEEVRHNRKILV